MMAAKSFAAAAATYGLAWLGTYTVLMSGDMKYLGEYFMLSWLGGGEIPAFIQFVAVTFGLVAWAVVYFRMKRTRR